MTTNFSFLQSEFHDIYEEAVAAEQHTFTAPRYAALLCRSAVEKAIFWLYENDDDLSLPYDAKLVSLLNADDFKTIIKPSMYVELDIVRRFGNNAAHGKKINRLEALQSLKNTFRFLSWLSKLYSLTNPNIAAFDERYIPYGDEQDKTAKQLEKLAADYDAERANAAKALQAQEKLAEENAALKAQLLAQTTLLQERKAARVAQYQDAEIVPPLTSETETRKQLIDLLLRDAGWNSFVEGKDIEYEVKGMPTSTNITGKGYVDYVLWDDNGKPLAVLEAKKTLHDAAKGKHQAVLYADCLEQQFGQRPIIYYSNGFDTYIWDDQFYPSRKVYGVHNKEALQTLIRRRADRQNLRSFPVNQAIAGRPYQLQAIQRVAEQFATMHNNKLVGRHRKALLVMATGSGKTRTAAAIVDMLTKCNWAKRILFLADRDALVTQAKNAFKEHLPQLSAIDLTKEKDQPEARVVFSTYPTMLNRIDELKNEANEKTYGIGHFDAIIIDEAHRSVYQKYQAIFDYFDALLIGLTATPKKDIDINTYRLFEIEDDNPTFAYELNEAVNSGYLVPPKAISVPLKFPREGVKYKELSEKDKAHFEELFGVDEETSGDAEIAKSKINSFLFNADTVDKVLHHLMTEGLRIESGDKLGKTIIFAKNHAHAVFIEERFNKNYPEYRGSFLQVIDNYTDKAQDLLERFCFDKGDEKDPQIAVSVDMMDTGVDAPRVLNLVFFKEVKSYAKFWQMIGRGTRLCPNIFGTGKDKDCFVIFDICGNFEFFDEHPDGLQTRTAKPLTQQLFEAQLEVVFAIQELEDASDEDAKFGKHYTDVLHSKIANLDENRFEVRLSWEMVKKYKSRAQWDRLNHTAILEIQTKLSHLAAYTDDKDEMAKKFDLLIYKLEIALLKVPQAQARLIANIVELANRLWEKRNIPVVKQKEAILIKVRSSDYWSNISLPSLEKLRTDLRNLMQLLQDDDKEKPVYAYFEDELEVKGIVVRDLLENYIALQSYKDRVEHFIKKNKNHLVIDKLYRNIPITPSELQNLEAFLTHEQFNKEEIEKEYGQIPLGLFVRRILGMDVAAAQAHFAGFIKESNLSANQMLFVQKMIDYLTLNGIIEKSMLTQPPFTDIDDNGFFGVFEDVEQSTRIIQLIDRISQNADVA